MADTEPDAAHAASVREPARETPVRHETDGLVVGGGAEVLLVERYGYLGGLATGEAAGTAAALSLRAGVDPPDLRVAHLRQALAEHGAIVSFDASG